MPMESELVTILDDNLQNVRRIFRSLSLMNAGIICYFTSNTENISLCLEERFKLSDLCFAELLEHENC